LSVCAQCALIPSGTPERVWAIGDLHGDVGCALHWVERTGLLRNASLPAAEWEWTEPSSQLVFLGDYIDRGPDSKAVLTLVRELTLRFPEHVHALLGNHELNLLLDRARSPSGGRYLEYAYAAAHPAQYEAWLPEGERTEDLDGVLRSLHDALLSVYRRGLHAQGVQMVPDGPSSIVEFVRPKAARPRVADALRRWQRAYMRGVSSDSPLGEFLHRPLSVHLAGTVFVHGGLAEELLDRELPHSPSAPVRPLDSLEALDELNARWLNATGGHAPPRPGETRESAEAAALAQSDLVAFASEMVEYRGLHGSYAGRYADRHSRRGRRRGAPPEQVACDRVAAVLRRLNVSRIAVGHTPEDSVRVRCGGRLLALDSTLSRRRRGYISIASRALPRAFPRLSSAFPRALPWLATSPRSQLSGARQLLLRRADGARGVSG